MYRPLMIGADRSETPRRGAARHRTPPSRRLLHALTRARGPAFTGVLAALAFPPFDLGPLVLVAPIPLLLSWRRAPGPRAAARDGFTAGVVFFGMVLVWAWYFGVVAYFPFVLVLALYWAAAGALVGALARRGLAGPWTVASAWVLMEALRGRWPFGGFSWGEMGYALHDLPWARSGAAWGGVLALSMAVVLFAAFTADAWAAARAGEWRVTRVRSLCAAAVLVTLALGHLTLPATRPSTTLRVAIVQGNDLNRDLGDAEVRERYLPRNHFRLASGLAEDVDLVVLPESSLDADPRSDPLLDQELARLARRSRAGVVANAPVEIEGGRRLHNTNFLYDTSGRLQDTYVKQHLVPYGEFVPGRRLLEGVVSELDQIPRDYAPGPRRRVFDVGGVAIANLICFESAFTDIARGYARDGAEVLLVSTNNRSFRRSANSAQHLAIGQIRAVETGRPVVQAAISGHSAFISAAGDIEATTELFEPTTLTRRVTGRTGSTPYTRFGDWVVVLAAAVTAVAAGRAGRFAPPSGGS